MISSMIVSLHELNVQLTPVDVLMVFTELPRAEYLW